MNLLPRRRRSRTGRGLVGAALAATIAVVALPTGPSPALAPRQPLWSADDGRAVVLTTLTRDGDDSYSVAPTAAGIRVAAAPTNTDSDTRALLHRPTSPSVADGESCASWGDRAGAIVQMGAALRIHHVDGAVRAITVTQNIWVSPFTFNIHTWDTSRPGRAFQLVGQVDMRDRFFAFGFVPLPWRFCARAVGDRVEFKVWSRPEGEPGWGDPAHSDGITLPEGWQGAGQVGWYVGHLEAGDHATLDDMSTWAYRPQQSMIPRPRR